MKFRLTLLFLIIHAGLSAQVDLKSLMGNWQVNSLTLNGSKQKTENLSYRIGDTDLGDYVLEQTFYDSEDGECVWVVLIVAKGGNKISHELLVDEVNCKCSLLGEYTYEFNNGILYISNSKNKLELVRKS